MENASKALLIAGGVLVGILILSLAVYLFNIFGEFAADTQSKIDANETAQFNAKFLQYAGRKDLTIQDIITVKNYALEHNKQYPNYAVNRDRAEDNNEYIDVYLGTNKTQVKLEGIGRLVLIKNDKNLLEQDIENSRKYTCEIVINNNTGLVNKIYFYYTD